MNADKTITTDDVVKVLRAQDMPNMAYGYDGGYKWHTENIGRDAADLIESLQADNERLRQWVNDLQSGMYVNCVYCGHRYGPEKDTPVSMADILKAHIEQCSEHPMSKLKAQLTERTAERDSYKRSFLVVEEERNECAKQLAEKDDIIASIRNYESEAEKQVARDGEQIKDLLSQLAESREREQAAVGDINRMGGCPNCLHNKGKHPSTGLPLCAKHKEFPDGNCFEWRGPVPGRTE